MSRYDHPRLKFRKFFFLFILTFFVLTLLSHIGTARFLTIFKLDEKEPESLAAS